ncbi:hypothetical protein D6Y71_00725 [Escherichia coli]|nr:hypothetical protein EB670_11570 [Escherichia coli]EFN7219310.1 hypothetical protein [Escherichia coli O21:H34]EAC2040814.1 hypothetical protein [Escherichia coli]EEW1614129.1 hypothetical protein [Escherichia coli]EEW7640869.1 hypothetical protein [Escherichia coli]
MTMDSNRLTDELIMKSIATTICFIERYDHEHPADHILLTSLLRHIYEEMALRVDERLPLDIPEGLPDFQAPITSEFDVDDWSNEDF